ncbi:hypothetical protein B0H19DRAFT_1385554 [Mycena capillaripes]|nr:hypothetical protein B0H19DRAFT_1385554 [Mycena capillaripes]
MSHFPPRQFPFGSPLFCLVLAQVCHLIPSIDVRYQQRVTLPSKTASQRPSPCHQMNSSGYLINIVEVSSGSTPLFAPVASMPSVSFDNAKTTTIGPTSTLNVNAAYDSAGINNAVVSSMYSDGFAIAVAVLGHSTRSANVSARLLLPYLEHKVSEKALCIVRATGWEPYAVPLIPPPHGGKGIHLRFVDQYTKLNIWKLDQMGVDSAVYLDADTLFNFAATPDAYGAGDPRGFSLTFNAGVLAFQPSTEVFENMREKIETAE